MKSIYYLFFSLLLFLNSSRSLAHSDVRAVSDLVARILPYGGDAQRFVLRIDRAMESRKDSFTIACDGRYVTVEGNNKIALAVGVNYYLQHKAGIQISWNMPTAQLPTSLPKCKREGHSSAVRWRYYLNFCTHSYTMAYWDWKRWQQEIDWMALHGVNMPLILMGMENVWKQTLAYYGYSMKEINAFLPANAWYGWFFMNNMTGYGASMDEHWYKRRQRLGRRIMERLKSLGMTPVIPGYVGILPSDFLKHAKKHVEGWKADDIVSGGQWCGFERPFCVVDSARLSECAKVYYGALKKVYGKSLSTHYYAIDPFHEGGLPKGINKAKAQQMVQAMWAALQKYDTSAVWVAQHWQGNPRNFLTKTVPAKRLLILNLHGDSHGRSDLLGEVRCDALGQHHDWIWGMTSNFGGNVGFFGRMPRVVDTWHKAMQQQEQHRLVGIGALPEGIENNEVLYELLYALPWQSSDYSLSQFLDDYVKMRYGLKAQTDTLLRSTLREVWDTLALGIYACPRDAQQGVTESVLMMRPDERVKGVSTWANATWYWNREGIVKAARTMLRLSDKLGDNPQYIYDLVNLTRQVVADYGKVCLDSIHALSGKERERYEDRFLELILLQDSLVGGRKAWRLSTWLDAARQWGRTKKEKESLERDARCLLTTWGDERQCNAGGLHDYANREWEGLLRSYYYPRWKAYFATHRNDPKWLYNALERPFVEGERGRVQKYLPSDAAYEYGSFKGNTTKGKAVETVREVWNALRRLGLEE